MRHPAPAVSRIPLHLVSFAVFAAVCVMTAAPVQATRGIAIDDNFWEAWGDAQDGDIFPLEFPINYGAGLQSKVTVNLPVTFTGTGSTANVGLTFTSSPSDSLFATVGPGGPGAPNYQVPAVSISNSHQISEPFDPVASASIFNFGIIVMGDLPPPYPCMTSFCAIYGPLADGANFQFVNLAPSGTVGDFELNITCTVYPCENIGFSLAGENFSSATFDAANPPPNLLSYSMDTYGNQFWSFVFRKPNAVPEPRTWAMMLFGFVAIGTALRPKRKQRSAFAEC